MMTPAHFFGGYIALRAAQKYWLRAAVTKRQATLLFIFGLLLSIGIDLDTLITQGIDGHHKLLTHYPLFWLAVSSSLFLLGRYSKKPIMQSIAILTLVSSWTHLLLDLVGITMGVHLLWPFSMKEFSVTPLTTSFASEQERWSYILNSPIMWIGDSIVVITGLITMWLDFNKTHRQGNK